MPIIVPRLQLPPVTGADAARKATTAPRLVFRYGLALIVVALALLVKLVAGVHLGSATPFLLFAVPITASAVYGGVGPGVLATLLSLLAIDYLFVSPGTFILYQVENLPVVGLFVLEGALITALGATATTTKRHAEQLRHSEARFRATFDQVAVGMAHVALDGRWLLVNHQLCDIVGYTRQELAARSFQDITHPDDLAADMEQVQRLVTGEIPTYTMEKWYILKDGSVVWVNLTVSLVRTPRDQPLYFISVVQNITAHKHAEAALQRSTAWQDDRVGNGRDHLHR
jgi:PAS domain S-box-containing protein